MHHVGFVGSFDGVASKGRLERDRPLGKVWLGDQVIVGFQGVYKLETSGNVSICS